MTTRPPPASEDAELPPVTVVHRCEVGTMHYVGQPVDLSLYLGRLTAAQLYAFGLQRHRASEGEPPPREAPIYDRAWRERNVSSPPDEKPEGSEAPRKVDLSRFAHVVPPDTSVLACRGTGRTQGDAQTRFDEEEQHEEDEREIDRLMRQPSPQEPQEARGPGVSDYLELLERAQNPKLAESIAKMILDRDTLRTRIAELTDDIADGRQTIAYAIDRHKALEDELAAVTRQRDDAHDDVRRVAREREQASRAAMLAERECLGLRAKLEAARALILEALIDVRHQGNLDLANRMAAFYHGKPALANPTDSAGEAEGKEKR